MILIQDEYFDEKTFKAIQEYCNQDFKIIKRGEKDFSVLETPIDLIPVLQKKGYKLIKTFIRSASSDFDTDLRIHADNIIEGHKTALASVFYINGQEVSTNGTCFYDHQLYGQKLPDVSNEEFDRLITNDSNDSNKWVMTDMVFSRPNRMLLYDSQMFHAKFPQKIEKGTRKVMVCFYSKE